MPPPLSSLFPFPSSLPPLPSRQPLGQQVLPPPPFLPRTPAQPPPGRGRGGLPPMRYEYGGRVFASAEALMRHAAGEGADICSDAFLRAIRQQEDRYRHDVAATGSVPREQAFRLPIADLRRVSGLERPRVAPCSEGFRRILSSHGLRPRAGAAPAGSGDGRRRGVAAAAAAAESVTARRPTTRAARRKGGEEEDEEVASAAGGRGGGGGRGSCDDREERDGDERRDRDYDRREGGGGGGGGGVSSRCCPPPAAVAERRRQRRRGGLGD